MKHYRFFLTAALAVTAFAFFSCDENPFRMNTDKEEGSDGKIPEGMISFNVKLNLDNALTTRYKAERVFVIGENGEKIGQCKGPYNDTFTVIVNKSLIETEQRLLVEFSRQSSPLDTLEILGGFPLALGILKSFHWIHPNEEKFYTIPEASGVITLPGDPVGATPDDETLNPQKIKSEHLMMGYSESTTDILSRIPGLPPIYKVDLDLSKVSSYTGDSYSCKMGFLTAAGGELRLDSFNNGANDSLPYKGYCGGDDWYLVQTVKADQQLKKGDPARLWLIFTHATDVPRVYCADIPAMPDEFGTITLKPDYAAIPINSSMFPYLFVSNAGMLGQISLPFNVCVPSKTDSYVLISRTYNLEAYSGVWQTQGIFSDFQGKFYGAGATVKIGQLTSADTYTNSGMFAVIKNSGDKDEHELTIPAVVADLTIEVPGVIVSPQCSTRLGGLAGYISGIVNLKNITVKGLGSTTFNGKASKAGGIAGEITQSATVSNVTYSPSSLAALPYGEGNPTDADAIDED
ncbi:MAG: hypothetical protein LBC77_08025 [Spirochaetaceae bacterium]|jgi:hypothetical protein|nr:hypothetical protein [Spirochaetaceae bacterium]